MKKFSTKAKRKIRADIRQPKSLLRVESLEARTLLSVEPIANAVVDGGDDTACIVLAAPLERREEINPICVDAAVLSNTVEISEVVASCVASEQWGALQEVFENYEGDPSSEEDELLIIESVDFDAETVDDSTLSLGAEREEGGMRSGGGGSGGGNLITPHFSGDGIEYNGGYLITEGVDFLITFTGGSVGDVVSATITHVGTNADDLRVISNTATIGVPGNNSAIEITAVQDALLEELDETFTVNLTVTNGSSTLTQSSFTITIMWRPEFDSLPDYNLSPVVVNDDYYRACVDSDALSGAELTYRRKQVGVFGGTVNGVSRVEYSIVQNSNNPNDPANFFTIDSDTGQIVLYQDAIDYIAATHGSYECDLQIKAENKNYLNISGGAPADVATVHVTFSNWDVQRDGDSKAQALPNDGASIDRLARIVGLNKDEFLDWLTLEYPYNAVELFDGTIKNCNQLLSGDKLLATSNPFFYVPNTMFAAYCFMGIYQNGTSSGQIGWDVDIPNFERLGFNVVPFVNYCDYVPSATEAVQIKRNFLVQLSGLSSNKELHGVYLVGHGSSQSFHVTNSTDNEDVYLGNSLVWELKYIDGNFANNHFDPEDDDDHHGSWTIAGALEYQLGAVIILACQSETGATALSSGATGSITKGFSTNILSHFENWVKEWRWDPYLYNDGNNQGGLQGTKRFFLTPLPQN